MVARNRSRQPVIAVGVTSSSRVSASRSYLHNMCSTTSAFRRDDHRPRSRRLDSPSVWPIDSSDAACSAPTWRSSRRWASWLQHVGPRRRAGLPRGARPSDGAVTIRLATAFTLSSTALGVFRAAARQGLTPTLTPTRCDSTPRRATKSQFSNLKTPSCDGLRRLDSSPCLDTWTDAQAASGDLSSSVVRLASLAQPSPIAAPRLAVGGQRLSIATILVDMLQNLLQNSTARWGSRCQRGARNGRF